jgi:hypothetical protein
MGQSQQEDAPTGSTDSSQRIFVRRCQHADFFKHEVGGSQISSFKIIQREDGDEII